MTGLASQCKQRLKGVASVLKGVEAILRMGPSRDPGPHIHQLGTWQALPQGTMGRVGGGCCPTDSLSDSQTSTSSARDDTAKQIPDSMPLASGSQSGAQYRVKSVKRRAAEALLAARYSLPGTMGLGLSPDLHASARQQHPLQPHHHHQQLFTTDADITVDSVEAAEPASSFSSLAPAISQLLGGSHSPRPAKMPRMGGAAGGPRLVSPSGSAVMASRHPHPSTSQLKAELVRVTVQRGGPAGQATNQQQQQQPRAAAESKPGVEVQPCGSTCACSASGWCQFKVSIPHIDWRRVFDEHPDRYARQTIHRGYEKYLLGQGLQVYVVQDVRYVEDALLRLKQSMQDDVLAIDLEWRPERDRSGIPSKVAVMQLSSATVCVVLHTKSFNFTLPIAVRQLLADKSISLVGFAWDNSDEQKLQSSFNFGRADFGNLYDLMVVAKELGYPGMSLARLTTMVLGFEMRKSKSVTCSNWANSTLTLQQIKYAAMDVFSTGQVFRGLRLWHSSPSPCPGCKVPVGAPVQPPALVCEVTGRIYTDVMAYEKNCQIRSMPVRVCKCEKCGRMASMPAAASTPAAPVRVTPARGQSKA